MPGKHSVAYTEYSSYQVALKFCNTLKDDPEKYPVLNISSPENRKILMSNPHIIDGRHKTFEDMMLYAEIYIITIRKLTSFISFLITGQISFLLQL